MITLATSMDEEAKKLFDKTGKNYIDLIVDWFDNARAGSVNVDDIKDLEIRFKRLQDAIKNAEEQMALIENLQAELIKKLSDRTIKQFADGVQKYFKESGYLNNINTEISNIYMTRWAKFIVDYMQRHHIPLVKLDIDKLAKEVGEYLMEHCRIYRKTHYCPYLKDSGFRVEGCDGHCCHGC